MTNIPPPSHRITISKPRELLSVANQEAAHPLLSGYNLLSVKHSHGRSPAISFFPPAIPLGIDVPKHVALEYKSHCQFQYACQRSKTSMQADGDEREANWQSGSRRQERKVAWSGDWRKHKHVAGVINEYTRKKPCGLSSPSLCVPNWFGALVVAHTRVQVFCICPRECEHSARLRILQQIWAKPDR